MIHEIYHVLSDLSLDESVIVSYPDGVAISCPIDLDVARLRAEVQSMYARVAVSPGETYYFHRGPGYAVEWLGYNADELAALPADVTACFAGVGNPLAEGCLPVGACVLDVGSGGGTDLLLAARQVGAAGRAIGVDMTDDMRQCARAGARACGFAHVELVAADATALPIESGSVDVVISNGVLNLVPEKERAVAEIARVLKRGGRLQIADIVSGVELSDSIRRDVELWTG